MLGPGVLKGGYEILSYAMGISIMFHLCEFIKLDYTMSPYHCSSVMILLRALQRRPKCRHEEFHFSSELVVLS